jgi:bifunctional DNase/RNase
MIFEKTRFVPVRTWRCHPFVLVFLGQTPYFTGMKSDVLPVEIRGILPANSGCAIFVGNNQKVFVIQVEHNMGAIIGMFLRDTPKERPLTHDLMNSIFKGFNLTIERVVITELKNSTYYARLVLQQENELGRKIVEIDARPSDCLALATAQKRPIFVSSPLFEQVEDMTEVLDRINENTGESGEPE